MSFTTVHRAPYHVYAVGCTIFPCSESNEKVKQGKKKKKEERESLLT